MKEQDERVEEVMSSSMSLPCMTKLIQELSYQLCSYRQVLQNWTGQQVVTDKKKDTNLLVCR